MKWFKHYANANTNKLIQALIAQPKGLENAMRYWLLLELLCGEFKNDTTVFEVSTRQLKDALHIKFDKKLTTFCQLLTNFSLTFDQESVNFVQTSDNFWKIETRIILDLMGKEFKRTRADRGHDASKKKKKEEEKELEIRKGITHNQPLTIIDNAPPYINQIDVIKLWNSKCPENKKFRGEFLGGGEHKMNFDNMINFPEFQEIAGWENLFDKAIESEWLKTQGPLSFTWIIKHDKALDVLSGKYSSSKKTAVQDFDPESLPDLKHAGSSL
jgi:hypothetical protein